MDLQSSLSDNKPKKVVYCKLGINDKYVLAQYFFDHMFENVFNSYDIEILSNYTGLSNDSIHKKLNYFKKNMSHNPTDAQNNLYLDDITTKSSKISLHMHIKSGSFPKVIGLLEYVINNPNTKIGLLKPHTYNTVLTEILYRELLGGLYVLPKPDYIIVPSIIKQKLDTIRPKFLDWVQEMYPNVLHSRQHASDVEDDSYNSDTPLLEACGLNSLSKRYSTSCQSIPIQNKRKQRHNKQIKYLVDIKGIDGDYQQLIWPKLLAGSLMEFGMCQDIGQQAVMLIYLLKSCISQTPLNNMLFDLEKHVDEVRILLDAGSPTAKNLATTFNKAPIYKTNPDLNLKKLVAKVIQMLISEVMKASTLKIESSYQISLGLIISNNNNVDSYVLGIFINSIDSDLHFVANSSYNTMTLNQTRFFAIDQYPELTWSLELLRDNNSENWIYYASNQMPNAWMYFHHNFYECRKVEIDKQVLSSSEDHNQHYHSDVKSILDPLHFDMYSSINTQPEMSRNGFSAWQGEFVSNEQKPFQASQDGGYRQFYSAPLAVEPYGTFETTTTCPTTIDTVASNAFTDPAIMNFDAILNQDLSNSTIPRIT